MQLRAGKERKTIFDLKPNRFVIFPDVTSGIVLGADDDQQRALGNLTHRPGLHAEGVQAVSGVELVRLPRSAVVQRFLQDHLLRSTRFKRDHDVVRQLDGFVPRQRDVHLQGFGVLLPRARLPECRRVSTLGVEHEVGRVREFLRRSVAFVIAHVGVLLWRASNTTAQC